MNTNKRFQWGAFIRLLVSSSGIVLSLIGIVGCFLLGFASIFMGMASYFDLYPFFSLGWAGLAVLFLLLPSAWNSLMRLLDKENRFRLIKPGIRLPSLLLFCLPLLLWFGDMLSAEESLAWLLLLPPLQVIIIMIPLWWLVELGRYGLKRKEESIGWDVFSFGAFITQPLAILLEFIAIMVIVVALALWIMAQPELVTQLQILYEQIMEPTLSPEAMLDIVMPYLQTPAVLFGIIFMFSILIPLIEEMLKPLALWSFFKRKLTPADGFVIGLMCGAVFGLLESLGMLSTPLGPDWTATAIGRIGTGILHSGTAALVGWGMVSAWRGASFVKFLLAFLFSSLFHGLWNYANIYIGIMPLVNESLADDGTFQIIQANASFIMMGASLFFLLIIVLGNRHFRKSEAMRENSDTIVEPAVEEPIEDADHHD